jgi:hypothetical protein
MAPAKRTRFDASVLAFDAILFCADWRITAEVQNRKNQTMVLGRALLDGSAYRNYLESSLVRRLLCSIDRPLACSSAPASGFQKASILQAQN